MRRWQTVVLWLVAFFTIPFVMIELGFAEHLIKAALYGLVFGALAHLSQSQYWQYLKNRELNPFSKRFGESPVPRPAETQPVPRTARLNTPTKRLWFLALLVGLFICGATFGMFMWQHPNHDFSRLFDYPYNYGIYKAVLLFGVTLATLGLLFSLFYDQLYGKLVQWVRGSRSAP